MDAKAVDEIGGILRSKSTDDTRKEGSTPRIPQRGLLNDEDDDSDDDDDVMNGRSEEKTYRTSKSPRIPREGLLQSDDDDGDDDDRSSMDSDDELDEDDDITLDEIVTWVSETDNRIAELDNKLQKTNHTKSGINRVLDELAKQYGLLEDMQVKINSRFFIQKNFFFVRFHLIYINLKSIYFTYIYMPDYDKICKFTNY